MREIMNGNDSWKNKEEIGIDLAELLRRICMQWKWLIVCGIVCAVLTCAYSFAKSRQSTAEESYAGITDDEMSKEEQQEIENAVQTAEEKQKLQEYLEESVLMQIDPYRKNSVVSLYSIDGAESQELVKIAEGYLNFLTNGGVTEALKEADGQKWKMNSCYLEELIQAWLRTDNTLRITGGEENTSLQGALFYVKVIGKDEKTTARLAEDIHNALEEYSAVMKKESGRHKLSLVNQMQNVSIDSSLQSQQREKKEALKGYETALKAALDALSIEQKAVYGLEEEEELLHETSWFHGKYVLAGFAGGVFLFCAIYACWYLLSGTIKSVSEFRLYYNIPLYGCLSVLEKQNKKKEQEKERILNRLRLLCRKQGIQKLCLAAGFAVDEKEQEYLEGIVKTLKEWGVEAIQTADAGRDISKWDMIMDNGYVLMLCRMGLTTHKMVNEQMEFYLENGVKVIGAVMLEEHSCGRKRFVLRKRKG